MSFEGADAKAVYGLVACGTTHYFDHVEIFGPRRPAGQATSLEYLHQLVCSFAVPPHAALVTSMSLWNDNFPSHRRLYFVPNLPDSKTGKATPRCSSSMASLSRHRYLAAEILDIQPENSDCVPAIMCRFPRLKSLASEATPAALIHAASAQECFVDVDVDVRAELDCHPDFPGNFAWPARPTTLLSFTAPKVHVYSSTRGDALISTRSGGQWVRDHFTLQLDLDAEVFGFRPARLQCVWSLQDASSMSLASCLVRCTFVCCPFDDSTTTISCLVRCQRLQKIDATSGDTASALALLASRVCLERNLALFCYFAVSCDDDMASLSFQTEQRLFGAVLTMLASPFFVLRQTIN
ncbi:hypothetical protein BDZ89DRAFT_1128714 [Hymenopellis radicata]|nr:hypothetical protein BDZ89DRAFT_1128714 [Hymenopellis radicata]